MSWVHDMTCAVCGHKRPSVVWRCPACHATRSESIHGREVYRGPKGFSNVVEYADGYEEPDERW